MRKVYLYMLLYVYILLVTHVGKPGVKRAIIYFSPNNAWVENSISTASRSSSSAAVGAFWAFSFFAAFHDVQYHKKFTTKARSFSCKLKGSTFSVISYLKKLNQWSDIFTSQQNTVSWSCKVDRSAESFIRTLAPHLLRLFDVLFCRLGFSEHYVNLEQNQIPPPPHIDQH